MVADEAWNQHEILDVKLYNSSINEGLRSHEIFSYVHADNRISLNCSARFSRALTEFYISRRTT